MKGDLYSRIYTSLFVFGDGDTDGFFGGGENDSGAGAGYSELVLQLCGQEMIEILRAAATNLEEVIVVASDMVALGDSFDFPDGAEKGSALAMVGQGNGDESGERIAESSGVGQRGVTANGAMLFELAHAIGGGGSGEV